MQLTKTLGTFVCFVAVATLLLLAAGCREEAKAPTPVPTAGGTVLPTSTSQDPEEAKIQAARSKLSAEDRKLADAQEWCVVQESRLGSMNTPVKLTIKGQPVFICCGNCKTEAEADPDATLKKVEALKAKKRAAPSAK
jgi:hypothetical protein